MSDTTKTTTTPTLTFDLPTEPQTPAVVESQEILAEEFSREETSEDAILTEEEKKIVEDFAEKIDLRNSGAILQYGVSAQKKMADFSENTLESVRTKDLGEVGSMLTSVVTELKGFEMDEEEKGFFGFMKKKANSVTALRAKYDKAEENVDKITDALEKHQMVLMKDVAMMDKMYELNLTYYKELTMYIMAGKKKLAGVRSGELAELEAKAKASGLPEDAQAAKDLADHCLRFEKKLHDLELSRMISIQTAPQLRLVQNNDTMMVEKIQSTIVNTIPLWKSQMVIALGVNHAAQAQKAQQEVTDMTNQLLKKNADALKMASLETAKASERGIVDMETLKHTNESLITTLDEVMRIQTEGREKRRAAEAELKAMEAQLKAKLLEIRK